MVLGLECLKIFQFHLINHSLPLHRVSKLISTYNPAHKDIFSFGKLFLSPDNTREGTLLSKVRAPLKLPRSIQNEPLHYAEVEKWGQKQPTLTNNFSVDFNPKISKFFTQLPRLPKNTNKKILKNIYLKKRKKILKTCSGCLLKSRLVSKNSSCDTKTK